jgi:hypothetical protein
VERPISFASRRLTPAETRYTTTERELLGVVYACAKWRHHLAGELFEVLTDHQALSWLLTITGASGRLCRWALALGEFTFNVRYRKGGLHVAPDALSRAPVDDAPFEEMPRQKDVWKPTWIGFEHQQDGGPRLNLPKLPGEATARVWPIPSEKGRDPDVSPEAPPSLAEGQTFDSQEKAPDEAGSAKEALACLVQYEHEVAILEDQPERSIPDLDGAEGPDPLAVQYEEDQEDSWEQDTCPMEDGYRA